MILGLSFKHEIQFTSTTAMEKIAGKSMVYLLVLKTTKHCFINYLTKNDTKKHKNL